MEDRRFFLAIPSQQSVDHRRFFFDLAHNLQRSQSWESVVATGMVSQKVFLCR